MRSLNLIDRAFFLKKSPIFDALDLDLLLAIADKMESVHYRPSDYVFHPGNEAHRMYWIVSGQIAILDKQGAELIELSWGECFGDESLFNEKRREYGAFCRAKVELLSLNRPHLLSIIQECPSVALTLLEAYSSTVPFRLR